MIRVIRKVTVDREEFNNLRGDGKEIVLLEAITGRGKAPLGGWYRYYRTGKDTHRFVRSRYSLTCDTDDLGFDTKVGAVVSNYHYTPVGTTK